MATTRVHILANELGVKSKAIIDKCKAEGLDVENHMSTISAGLAATIREWFSEGEHTTTAVETAEHVDLKKVRIKKKKKPVEAVVEEPPAEQTPALAEHEPQTTVTTTEPPPPAPAPEETVQPSAPVIEKEPEPVKLEIITEHPKPPEPVMPAGPKLGKPKPAQLTGPRIIRVEAPEHVERPRPKPRPQQKPSYQQAASEPLLASMPESMESKLGTGKSKKKTHGRRHEELVAEEISRQQKASRKLRSRDLEERRARLEAAGGEGMRLRPVRKIETRKTAEEAPKIKPEKAYVSEPIIVKDLSAALAVKTSEIIGRLIAHGIMANANQVIPAEIAELVALDLGTELVVQAKQTIEQQIAEEFEKRPRENIQKRPAVAIMLGHVDHGKTSLLDRIRSAKVAAGEAGGITQHIGAYQVTWGDKTNPKRVTFLDTPGHEAFTAMRARGANMTDIAVLVMAADDGIMPQTVEAIHHAKAANVHIIVALNKIDLPSIDVNRLYGQLAEHELTPIEWGGKTDVVKTSATTGQGIEELLEHLDYASELLELKADSTIPAMGWVVEAKISPNRGPVVSLLIKEGKLKKGDIILAGTSYGRIRTLKDSFGYRNWCPK